MPAQVAPSALAVPHSRIREIADMAMAIDAEARTPQERVLRLYFGESNLPTPLLIQEAARRAMAEGYTYYTENAGLPSTRAALARYYRALHGVELDPAREIVITASGVQALNVAIRCVLDPGDEAIVLTPCWPNGPAIIQMCNVRVREVPHLLRANHCQIDFAALENAVTPQTRLLLYTSPSNPLGWVAGVEDQQRLLNFARRHGIWLMADEVYERLYYAGGSGAPAPSILRLASRDDAVIVIQSFSKSYCMTGWRVGWLVSRGDLCARAAQLNEFIVSHAPSFSQRAAEAALDGGEPLILDMLARLRRTRDAAREMLAGAPGVEIPDPEGAFYLFPRIRGIGNSFDFCRRLLLEARVGLAPGGAFGAGGEGCVRICYAAEDNIVTEALRRLRRFLQ